MGGGDVMELKVGDRVAAYNYAGRKTGKIAQINESGHLVIDLDRVINGYSVLITHPKACRRLKKIKRRRVWIQKDDVDQLFDKKNNNYPLAMLRDCPGQPMQRGPWIELIEVRRK